MVSFMDSGRSREHPETLVSDVDCRVNVAVVDDAAFRNLLFLAAGISADVTVTNIFSGGICSLEYNDIVILNITNPISSVISLNRGNMKAGTRSVGVPCSRSKNVCISGWIITIVFYRNSSACSCVYRPRT